MTGPGGRAKRTRLTPEARRAQLLDIGVDLLLSEPLENLTVDRVAATAQVSRGLVFHYFPTVRDLHLACLEMAAADLVAQVSKAADDDSGESRARQGLDAFVDYINQRRQTFLTMSSYAADDEDFGRIFEEVRSQMVDLIRERADIPPDPLAILMLRSWVSYVEASVLQWMNDAPVDRGELVEMLVAVRVGVEQTWRDRTARSA